IQFSAVAALVKNREYGPRELTEFLLRLFARFASRLIDDLQNFFPALGRKLLLLQKVDPEFAVTDSDHEILFRETEAAQNIDAQSDQLDVGGEVRFTDDVAV